MCSAICGAGRNCRAAIAA
ncbi:UNVERIFIED_CONTAM: hypothetical protein GTU68_014374 [Idotea baltica]|nr:hypothetical protein [Idotea baltica]